MYSPVANNEELVSQLERHVNIYGVKIEKLIVAAHGWRDSGGVVYEHGGFNVDTLTADPQNQQWVRRLKAVLADDADVLIFGCETALDKDNEEKLQELANELDRTVWGTNYDTVPCTRPMDGIPAWFPGWARDFIFRLHGLDAAWDRFDPQQ